jgi:signal peptidase I
MNQARPRAALLFCERVAAAIWVMTDCPAETGVHLIVDSWLPANNQSSPSSMLLLKLKEESALVEPPEDTLEVEPAPRTAARIDNIIPSHSADLAPGQIADLGSRPNTGSATGQAVAIEPAGELELTEENGDRLGEADAIGPANESDEKFIQPTIFSQAQAGSASATQANDSKPASRMRAWRLSWRRLIVLTALVLGIRTFVGEASVVPTASMEGTILVGDHLFMDKLLYGPEIPLVHWRLPMLRTIRRGDIIVFRYPKNPSETYLKRVAAVGGDRLEIRNGILYVNSLPVPEPYAVHRVPLHSAQESWGPTVVPSGNLFVMGDNRDNSSDSRDWGFVPVKNVVGEPLFVYWSYDAPTARWLDENPAHRISFYASIVENFFSRTRWKRTGMLL